MLHAVNFYRSLENSLYISNDLFGLNMYIFFMVMLLCVKEFAKLHIYFGLLAGKVCCDSCFCVFGGSRAILRCLRGWFPKPLVSYYLKHLAPWVQRGGVAYCTIAMRWSRGKGGGV